MNQNPPTREQIAAALDKLHALFEVAIQREQEECAKAICDYCRKHEIYELPRAAMNHRIYSDGALLHRTKRTGYQVPCAASAIWSRPRVPVQSVPAAGALNPQTEILRVWFESMNAADPHHCEEHSEVEEMKP